MAKPVAHPCVRLGSAVNEQLWRSLIEAANQAVTRQNYGCSVLQLRAKCLRNSIDYVILRMPEQWKNLLGSLACQLCQVNLEVKGTTSQLISCTSW